MEKIHDLEVNKSLEISQEVGRDITIIVDQVVEILDIF